MGIQYHQTHRQTVSKLIPGKGGWDLRSVCELGPPHRLCPEQKSAQSLNLSTAHECLGQSRQAAESADFSQSLEDGGSPASESLKGLMCVQKLKLPSPLMEVNIFLVCFGGSAFAFETGSA